MATLREQLKKDGLTGTDTAIFVHMDYLDMSVSARYLEGGWEELLDRPVRDKIGREYWI